MARLRPFRILLAAALLAGPACGMRFDDHAALRDNPCVSCHEDDRPSGHFDGQDCGECHATASWDGAHFDHDFPLPHGEGVQDCSECHLGGDLTDFSCTHCHEHSQAETDDHHDDVGNYVWESHACLDCHPNGGEGDDDR